MIGDIKRIIADLPWYDKNTAGMTLTADEVSAVRALSAGLEAEKRRKMLIAGDKANLRLELAQVKAQRDKEIVRAEAAEEELMAAQGQIADAQAADARVKELEETNAALRAANDMLLRTITGGDNE